MNQEHLSLTIFTVTSQSAIGMLLFRELMLARNKDESGLSGFRKKSLPVIIAMLAVAAGSSFFHSGNPGHIVFTFKNLAASWLSREVLSASLFSATLLLYLLAELKTKNSLLIRLCSIVSVIMALMFIFCMIMIYMIPSVPAWYNPATPAGFVLTALVCGLSGIYLVEHKNGRAFRSFIFPLLVIFILFSIITSSISYFSSGITFPLLFAGRILSGTTALIILPAIFLKYKLNKTGGWQVILFIIVTASELTGRYIFFLSLGQSRL